MTDKTLIDYQPAIDRLQGLLDENDAAREQIQEDRSEEASFEATQIKRIKLDALEEERKNLNRRLRNLLALREDIDPIFGGRVFMRRPGQQDPRP